MSSGFRVRRVVVVSTLLVSMGCFTLKPVTGQPLPLGTVVSLSINDAGRAVLSGTMGPEISDIEGRLVQKDSAEYVLAVSLVKLMRGGEQVWSGERIRVKSEFVSGVMERKFSRSRTAFVVSAAAGAIALIASQGILGDKSGDADGKLPPDTGISIKYPRFIKR